MSHTEVALLEAKQNEYDIFEKDILDREEFVQTMLDISVSRSNAKDNVTFAVDGAWGTGKTFVLDLFEKKAETEYNPDTNDERFLILHYNCWKYDYYEEPLVALIAAITDQIEDKIRLLDEYKRKLLEEILNGWIKDTSKIISGILKTKTGSDIGLITSEYKSIFKRAKQKVEEAHSYDKLYTFRTILSELQKQIAAIAKNRTILLVVDELDRCTPDYAIKVLERIHHLTEEMENTITILCYDKTKIQCFVETVFGIEKGNNYLTKFVKFELKLDSGRLQRGDCKFQDYYELFPDNALGISETVDEYKTALFQEIDIREHEQLIEIARLCHTMLTEEKMDRLTLFTELLMVVALYKCEDKSLDAVANYKADFQNIFAQARRVTEINASAARINNLFAEKTDGCYSSVLAVGGPSPYYEIREINAFTAVLYCWFYLHKKRAGDIKAEIGRCQSEIFQQTINNQQTFLKKYWDMLKRINK